MSESNDSRIEARECIRKANDSQERWAWLVLAKTLLLAKTQEIAENSIARGAGVSALRSEDV
jgi:hypothetical protein